MYTSNEVYVNNLFQMSYIGKRLNQIVLLKNKNLKDFSTDSKIPYATLQQYASGKRRPTTDVLIKIKTHSNISIDWLLTGEGEMYNTPQKGDVVLVEKGKTVKEIDEHLKKLNPEQREKVFGMTLEMVRMNELEEKVEKLEKLVGNIGDKGGVG
ncbi:MAG: helix-turn-helix transcriptional regulator [Candidatus Parabeggiatoa sp.]|nr:helix-turn-helix transcriptional regulator [Candidatus Parabeggiatoa sp.]